jgi:SAM-dependent methyltransferase
MNEALEIINPILFWIGMYMVGWNAYFLVFNKGIPNIRTAPAIRKEIISRLKTLASTTNQSPFTILDMGCGNGDFSKEIATAIPEAKVIGIEVSRLSYWRACLLKKRSGLSNLEFRRADFYKTDISEADIVVMFLLGTLMGRIREKLESDLMPGTYVFSNKFKVGGDWAPIETVDVKTLAPNQKTFYIYKR